MRTDIYIVPCYTKVRITCESTSAIWEFLEPNLRQAICTTMFHIIALIILFAGTISDAFDNETKDHDCSELSKRRLGNLWFHDADLVEAELQSRCRANNSSDILCSRKTVRVCVKCESLLQGPGFWKIFLIGAAAGAGFMLIIALTVTMACCCYKKRKANHLVKSEEVESNNADISIPISISVDNETIQPLCQNESNADGNDSNHDDAVIEVDDTTESDYLTPVDSQTNIEHENDARHMKTSEATIYQHPINKARLKLPKSTTTANGGDKNDAPVDSHYNIEHENDAHRKRTEATIYSQPNGRLTPPKSTTTENGRDKSDTPETSVFKTRKSGKDRYQNLIYPTYENCTKDKRIYMSLLEDDNQSDDQSKIRAPSVVAYVNLPKRSSPLLRNIQQ